MAEEVIVKSKDIYYRGQLLERLKEMNVREVAKYLPSRNRRSVLRGFDKIEKFVRRCKIQLEQRKKIRTHLRDMVIVPHFVDMTIAVYNGKTFQDITIIPKMIGHRLGEFALTRERVVHGNPGIGSTKSSAGEKK